MTDAELIEAWAQRRSEAAFAELVSRYVNLVYNSALRQVGDWQLAHDVSQAVFLVLARKGAAISKKVILAGWFFRTTRFVATRALRGEARRRHYEQQAAASVKPQTSPPDSDERDWTEAAPFLDEAIASLPGRDRDAVLLRFFQEQPMRAVGEKLGVSEDAAKKRVSRAVDRLKDFFVRRGIALSVAGVAAVLSRSAAQAAPHGLAQGIAAAQGGAMAPASVMALAALAVRQLLWWKLRVPIAIGAVAVAALIVLRATGTGTTHPVQPVSTAGGRTNSAIVASLAAGQTTKRPASASVLNAVTQRIFLLGLRSALDNQPISGAKVTVNCWGSYDVVQSMDFESNTNGICEMPIPENEFNTFRVWVSAADFVPIVMDWKSYELQEPIRSYTAKLQRGLSIQGVVQDDQGNPLAGAKITFLGPGVNMTQRENVGFNKHLSVVQTDVSGRFLGSQMPSDAPLGMGLAVSHPDFAVSWAPVKIPEGLQTNWLIVLNRGISVSGKVVTTNGEAIAGAHLNARESHGTFDVDANGDANGEFSLAHMPAGTLEFKVSAPGFFDARRTVLVDSNAAPLQFPLMPGNMIAGEADARQPIRLTGRVVDAKTDEPITRFKVLLDERRGTSRDLLGEGRQGAFDWHNPLTYAREYNLEVDADGYKAQASSVRKRSDGDQSFEFRLSKGGVISGQVLQPDGQPAGGARIGLQNERLGLHFQPPAKLVNYGHAVNETTSDSQGSFSLPSMIGMEFILAVHESGCAALPAVSQTNLTIQLQAWGAIEGTLYAGTTPAAGQSVQVGFQSTAYAPDLARIPFDLTEKTDADGHFRFDRVPPGTHTVYRYVNPHGDRPGPIGFSHQELVTVRPGETARVTIGGKGRAVIGHFLLSPPLPDYDWRSKLIALVQNRPDLVAPKMEQSPSDAGFFRLWNIYDASIAKYYLEIQADGSFQVTDVLPGEYTLAVPINEPPADSLDETAWLHPGPSLGGITNAVVVPQPAKDEIQPPLDLGQIIIPIRSPAAKQASARARW